jgi:hypothetical protein
VSAPGSPLQPNIHKHKVASSIYFIEVATPTDQSRKKVVLAR